MTRRRFGPPYSDQEQLEELMAASQVPLTPEMELLADHSRGALGPDELARLHARLATDHAFRALAGPLLRVIRERTPTVRTIAPEDLANLEQRIAHSLRAGSTRLDASEHTHAARRLVVSMGAALVLLVGSTFLAWRLQPDWFAPPIREATGGSVQLDQGVRLFVREEGHLWWYTRRDPDGSRRAVLDGEAQLDIAYDARREPTPRLRIETVDAVVTLSYGSLDITRSADGGTVLRLGSGVATAFPRGPAPHPTPRPLPVNQPLVFRYGKPHP